MNELQGSAPKEEILANLPNIPANISATSNSTVNYENSHQIASSMQFVEQTDVPKDNLEALEKSTGKVPPVKRESGRCNKADMSSLLDTTRIIKSAGNSKAAKSSKNKKGQSPTDMSRQMEVVEESDTDNDEDMALSDTDHVLNPEEGNPINEQPEATDAQAAATKPPLMKPLRNNLLALSSPLMTARRKLLPQAQPKSL